MLQMAQSENAVPNGTGTMDLISSASDNGTAETPEVTMSELKNTIIGGKDQLISDGITSLVEKISSSCDSGNSNASNDAPSQSDDQPSESFEKNQEKAESNLNENKTDPVDKLFGESDIHTDPALVIADSSVPDVKSIDAVSLADIRTSFVDNQEVGDGDCKTEDTDNGSNRFIGLESQMKNDTICSNTSIDTNVPNGSTSTQSSANLHPDTVSECTDTVSECTIDNDNDSSKPRDSPDIDCESDNRVKKSTSNYEIQPGELTNQLIEGPSITLPSSEISNRNSSSAAGNCLTTSDKNIIVSVEHDDSGKNCVSSSSDQVVTDQDQQPKSSTQSLATTSSISLPDNNSTIIGEQRLSGSLGKASTPPATSTTTTPMTSAPAPAKRMKKTPDDFIFGKMLGEGSYSTVYLAKEVSSQREFAVKVCEKKHLIREKKTHFVMREKEVLMKLDHAFFIRLAYTFQDSERLYYVLTYARNGELLSYLNKLSVFDVPCTRFYSAEVVIALEYLQSLGIVHRDLKPENILLGEDMHIKISDFGTSKFINGKPEATGDRPGKRKNSFVGTAEYVSPEVLNGQPANYGTDLWALACIIYQCLSSCLPFRSGNEYQTFQKILKLEYEFPEGFHEDAKDLVQRLLVLEPTERLGMKQPGGMEELKQHLFFQGIEWATIPTTTPPKLLPYLPASANNPEFWGEQEQRTGFDDQRLAEIITGQSERSTSPELEPVPVSKENESAEVERREKLDKQRQENQFHPFVSNNLIVRQGFVDKRKGFFARKRMLLLTEGPHLYYVDAHNKVLKGEIPWSKELRAEAKNFKIFFVHTPNRTYYLESRHPDAHHWVKRIQDVWNKYYANEEESDCKKGT